MDIDLKVEAEWWGKAWLDQLREARRRDDASAIQSFEVFIRPRLTELIEMKRFSRVELVQWIENAHGIAARGIFGYQTVIRDRERLLEIDPAKLVEEPKGRPN